VFAVLCANVCSLLLASMTARRREIQVRAALGASRTRLFGQIALEHACIGAAGAALGIAIAWMLVGLSRGFLPDAFLLRTLHPIDLDSRALIVATLAGVAGTVAAGLVPAWLGTRAGASLVDTGRAATPSKAARGLTSALLVSEIAVACALLVGAALLVRSFAKLANAERGLRTDGVLTVWISLPPKPYADRASRLTAGSAIERAVRSLSGVSRVALSYGIPPHGGSTHYYDDWRGDDPASGSQTLEVESYEVGPEFFDLYGIPLREGRTFRPDDAEDAAIVSERLSALLWSGQSPVGRGFSFGSRHLKVIGVAREVRLPSLEASQDLPEFYERFSGGRSLLSVNVLCVPHCPNEAEVRLAIGGAAPRAIVAEMGAPAAAYIEELARPRASAALATLFGVIAALAVAGGLFSVLTFAVAARRREFGIRAAIGASPRSLRTVVYGDALRVGAVGVALGLVLAAAVAHAIRALVYGVTVDDPQSWMTVIAVLTATMAVACWRPARTAARVDPVILLRTE
jgi:predicted permease